MALHEFQKGTSSGVAWSSSGLETCKNIGRGRLKCFLHCVALSAKDIHYLVIFNVACVE